MRCPSIGQVIEEFILSIRFHYVSLLYIVMYHKEDDLYRDRAIIIIIN